MRDIRAFARRVVAEFKPRRIILFGSHAIGAARPDSDVDLLVVMHYRGHPLRRAAEMIARLDPPFAVDLLVWSPQELRQRYRQEDWFIRDIVDKGKVLYEARHARVGGQGRSRLQFGAAAPNATGWIHTRHSAGHSTSMILH